MWREKLRWLVDSMASQLLAGVGFTFLLFIRRFFKKVQGVGGGSQERSNSLAMQTIKENEMAEEVVEKKAVEFKIEGEYMVLAVDPNKDGEQLVELKVHLKEVPDEILSALKK